MKEEKHVCSFCGKPQQLAKKLIASPNGSVYICDECVNVCKEIIGSTEKPEKLSEMIKLMPPNQIKAILDTYIVGQDDAKKALSVAVYNHYKRINYNLIAKKKKNDEEIELDKSNILLIGPTGCGKTLLAKTLARVLDVPFATADATTLTEAGYVGEDVENILLKLIKNADYDIKKAERGIIYVDEIDKIARKTQNVSITRDVSGEGVQQALLKIVESTIASVPPAGGRKHPNQEMIQINTKNILFICGGAFVGLDSIISRRKNDSSLGFNAEVKAKKDEKSVERIKDIQPQDLIKFGMIPEFVGRFPVNVSLSNLDQNALVKIMVEPKNSIIKQYVKMFKIDGVDVEFTNEFIQAVAQKAVALKTGARGLRTIMEESMLEVMFKVPQEENLEKVVITKEHLLGTGEPEYHYAEKPKTDEQNAV